MILYFSLYKREIGNIKQRMALRRPEALFYLEDIFLLNQNYINKLLTLNNWSLQSPLIDRLSATILLHNGSYLIPEDNKYVTDNIFNTLYLYDDTALVEITKILVLIEPNVDRIKLIRKIINLFNDFAEEDENSMNDLLLTAASDGILSIVQLSLIKGATIHAIDDSPLIDASQEGHIEIVKFLIEKGANIHTNDDKPLQVASEHGQNNIVQLLLTNGADIHAAKDLPLILAAKNGHNDTIRLLVENMADLHAQDGKVLQSAAEEGHIDTVQLLLLLEKESYIRANNDKALKIAVINDQYDMVQFLLDNGADIHSNNDEPLQDAVEWGYTEIVRLLLKNGANIHANNDYALRLAAEEEYTKIVELLLENGAHFDKLSNELQDKYRHLMLKK